MEALRARVAATRRPDQELVKDHSQGPQPAVVQELARYWATEHDWRRCEAKLTAVPRAAGPSGPTPGSSTSTSSAKGSHFAAWQEPALFSAELRAAFRSLRQDGRSGRPE